MKYFVDRQSQFMNQKRLKIKEVIRENNGELSEIVAIVERDEGNISKSGTPLNAATFNTAFENIDMAMSLLVKKVLLEVENDLTVSWVQGEELHSDTLTIHLLERQLYAKVVNYPDYWLTITILNNLEDITVTVSETKPLNDVNESGTLMIKFDLELFFDKDFMRYCTTLNGKVEYILNSTNPDD